MLVTLKNNTKYINVNNVEYNYVFVGDTLVWSRLPILSNGFMKYYYGNIDRMFYNKYLSSSSSAINDMFMKNTFMTDISDIYKTNAYSNVSTNSKDFSEEFIVHIIKGIYEKSLENTFMTNSIYGNITAIEDMFMKNTFITNISPKFVNIEAYSNSNKDFSEEFIVHIIKGIYENDLLHNFISNIANVSQTAINDMFMKNTFITNINTFYPLANGYSNSDKDFSEEFISHIIKGIYENDLNNIYTDISTIVSQTAINDMFMKNTFITNISTIYNVLAKSFINNTIEFRYNVPGIYDQTLTFASANIPEKF